MLPRSAIWCYVWLVRIRVGVIAGFKAKRSGSDIGWGDGAPDTRCGGSYPDVTT